jgi:hypothetical protein
MYYYCWTHGLGPHRTHMSRTCLHKADGHQDDATAFRVRGGNNTIASGRPRPDDAGSLRVQLQTILI